MRFHFDLPFFGARVRTSVEGPSADAVVRQLRLEARSRLPWHRLKVALLLDDHDFCRLVVGSYNRLHAALEPIPATAGEFLGFAERAGFLAVTH